MLVLMSTFNGERFLKVQIDSIKNQNNQCIHLLIRDDASIDSTVQILESLIDKRDTLIIGRKRLGVFQSYSHLMSRNELRDFEYISLSDQDDFWFPNKVEIATSFLKLNPNIGVFCGNRITVDETLHVLTRNRSKRCSGILTLRDFVFENPVYGNTIVARGNYIRQILNRLNARNSFLDLNIGLIASLEHRLYYDSQATLFYRLHNRNTVGIPRSHLWTPIRSLKSAIRRIEIVEDFLRNSQTSQISNMELKRFYRAAITSGRRNTRLGIIVLLLICLGKL